jgi:hypothetical protein
MSRRFNLVLHHSPKAEDAHYDLFLEQADGLFSLRVERSPDPDWASFVVGARQFDHRKRYLDYEGPISGDRGWIERVDSGQMSGEPGADAVLRFEGELLSGSYVLRALGEERYRLHAIMKRPGAQRASP